MSLIEEALKHLERLVDLNLNRPELKLGKLDLNTGPPSSANFPVDILPDSRTLYFEGRDQCLLDIATYFISGQTERNQLLIYSICGIGGVGKTELALRYSKQYAEEYDARLWVRADSPESLRLGFTRIAIELGLPEAKVDGDPDHNLALVLHWFRVSGM